MTSRLQLILLAKQAINYIIIPCIPRKKRYMNQIGCTQDVCVAFYLVLRKSKGF